MEFLKSSPAVKKARSTRPSMGTTLIHVGSEPCPLTGSVIPGIFPSTTFAQRELGENPGKDCENSYGNGFGYSRGGNYTRGGFERAVAGAEGADYCIAYSSGCAAISAVITSVCKPGSHVIGVDDIYGGSRRLFTRIVHPHAGITFSFIDFNDEELLAKTLREHPNTSLLWLETPTNPTLKVFDIAKTASIASDNGIVLAVDNTFSSPYCQNPLTLGADIVVHSVTKYINGHSDVVMGCCCTSSPSLHEGLRFTQNSVGAVPSPFDCYLALRGLKTLHLRMEAGCRNAQAVAEFLEQHPKVVKVHYPGLLCHPQHELSKRQQVGGFGAVLSFRIKGGIEGARQFLNRLNIFALAESLGAVESLAESPALMTHASVPEEERKKVGIEGDLIRLAVGCEGVGDLVEDLEQALEGVV